MSPQPVKKNTRCIFYDRRLAFCMHTSKHFYTRSQVTGCHDLRLLIYDHGRRRRGGGGIPPPPDQNSEGDVPPEIAIFTDVF